MAYGREQLFKQTQLTYLAQSRIEPVTLGLNYTVVKNSAVVVHAGCHLDFRNVRRPLSIYWEMAGNANEYPASSTSQPLATPSLNRCARKERSTWGKSRCH